MLLRWCLRGCPQIADRKRCSVAGVYARRDDESYQKVWRGGATQQKCPHRKPFDGRYLRTPPNLKWAICFQSLLAVATAKVSAQDSTVSASEADAARTQALKEAAAPAAPAVKAVEAPKAATAPDLAKSANSKDVLSWDINGGATLNTGNTRAFLGSLGTNFKWRGGQNQVTADAQGVYGRAAVKDKTTGALSPVQENAKNINAGVRYDRYLSTYDALYLGTKFRHDRFAGLDARWQGQVGYLRDIIQVEKHRLWFEVGYDLTVDKWFAYGVTLPADGETVHAGRLFAGYENRLNDHVSFLTGLESLINLELPKDTRINWISQLNSKIAERFQIGLQMAFRFDNVPVPGAEKLDTLTTLNLIYSML